MARSKECPDCGQDISDSYESDDPDTGIVGGWYCDVCDKGFYDEYEPLEDDVQVFACGGDTTSVHQDRCQTHPEAVPEMGYGLAGGGIGLYSYCPICYAILSKSQDHV